MKILIDNRDFMFLTTQLKVENKNQQNLFEGNKKTLGYKLKKAINNEKDRLHKISSSFYDKYQDKLDMSFGCFLKMLKDNNNPDYLFFLNKHGDLSYCDFMLENFKNDKGLYCFIINDEIKYIGRSKKTFKERINEYGKITPYNCLIDGQATNCKINSKINSLNNSLIFIGFYLMNTSTDIEISDLEKKMIKSLNDEGYDLWNTQIN